MMVFGATQCVFIFTHGSSRLLRGKVFSIHSCNKGAMKILYQHPSSLHCDVQLNFRVCVHVD